MSLQEREKIRLGRKDDQPPEPPASKFWLYLVILVVIAIAGITFWSHH